ncbi:MAG: hypothetical protein MUC54_04580 [Chloroflexi bacterium]|nr:hypothetical protein [Chloroflexota bacterium]
MGKPEQLTPALEAAARRRREVREALLGVEEAISSPAVEPDRWQARVRVALAELDEAFELHVLETERRGGLYEEMEQLASHLAGKAHRLRDEHAVIRTSIAAEQARLEVALSAEAIEQVRDDLQRLLGRIVRHRQHGADLVWEAYAIDIGGAG